MKLEKWRRWATVWKEHGGAPSRALTPSACPDRTSIPPSPPGPRGSLAGCVAQGTALLGPVSNLMNWPTLPPGAVKRLKEGDRGDDPVRCLASPQHCGHVRGGALKEPRPAHL